MKYKLNVRQQKYKKNIILGMTKYNAAIAAGYSETTAKVHTKQLDQRCNIADAMQRMGLTDKILIEKLIELLGATKVIGYLHQYKKVEEGRIEKISPSETVSNDFIDVPDNSVRAKALELALKLSGNLRDKVDHQVAVTYKEMKRIVIEHKLMPLDIGEDVIETNRLGEV